MTETDDRRPNAAQLIAVVLAGTLHVTSELFVSPFAARVVNGLLVAAFAIWVAWRVRRGGSETLRGWGLRTDNFWPALGAQMAFAVASALFLAAIGVVLGTLSLPPTFLLTLAVYPLWGLAQQFALQNLIAGNLPERLGSLGIALVAATLFAASHFPRWELMTLTFLGGVPFTLLYRRFPNLWAVALAHGLLGSLAFYLVLGEDPGTMILNALP